MKALLVLLLFVAATSGASAQGAATVLVDPDFGLTFQTPAGFEAEMVGQTPEGLVLITVSTGNPNLPAFDPSGKLCDITFQYDPAYGQADQPWVNALVDDTGFYERMAQEVIVPGTVESSEHFSHRGSSGHRFYGQHALGGVFTVAAIPSLEGFVLVSCITSKPVVDWDAIAPVIDAITMPGQQRDHLLAHGSCEADLTALQAALAQAGAGPFNGDTIAALDVGRQQMAATGDEASGYRYVRYMHFIVGLRSLD